MAKYVINPKDLEFLEENRIQIQSTLRCIRSHIFDGECRWLDERDKNNLMFLIDMLERK